MGRDLAEGRVAALERQLALGRQALQDMRRAHGQLEDVAGHLDAEAEDLQAQARAHMRAPACMHAHLPACMRDSLPKRLPACVRMQRRAHACALPPSLPCQACWPCCIRRCVAVPRAWRRAS